MKKDLYKKIEIPEGVDVEITGSLVKVKGPEGENQREFKINSLNLEKKGKEIIIGKKGSTKKEKKLMNTLAAHITNMINGIQKKFEYDLKAVFSHFPISLEVKGKEVLIKNFLGEKTPRSAKLPEGVDIEVDGQQIKITSSDRELAGLAASRLEAATKVGSRDRRIFQDGIFLTKKAGKEI